MDDKAFLSEFALILESEQSLSVEDSRGTKYIRIEENSAKEWAQRLRHIANKMPETVQ
jgi:hypothetical protein